MSQYEKLYRIGIMGAGIALFPHYPHTTATGNSDNPPS